MHPKTCAAFEANGRTHIIYSDDSHLVEVTRNYAPRGVPFIVMNTTDLPTRETRDSWSFDYSNPAGIGANDAYIPAE